MSLQDSTQGYILSSPRTVFTLPSIIVDTQEEDMSKLTKRLHYYKKKGVLRSLRKGLYAKWDYNEQEVACSLYTPCYLSLEYVLQRAGVIFQYDECLTCVSFWIRFIFIHTFISITQIFSTRKRSWNSYPFMKIKKWRNELLEY